MNMEDILKYEPSGAVVELYHELVQAIGELDRVRPIVTEYQKRILAEHGWTNKTEVALLRESNLPCDEYVILDPEKLYLLSDEDAKTFFELCHREALKNGFEVPEFGICPLLTEEQKVRVAKKRLLALFLAETNVYLGLTINQVLAAGLDLYEQMVELVVMVLKSYIAAHDLSGMIGLAKELMSNKN